MSASKLGEAFVTITVSTHGFRAALPYDPQDELALARMDDDGWGSAITAEQET